MKQCITYRIRPVRWLRTPVYGGMIWAMTFLIMTSCEPYISKRQNPQPNDPCTVSLEGKQIALLYAGDTLLFATVENATDNYRLNQIVDGTSGAIHQVISFTSVGDEPIHIHGWIQGSDESFPCEADRPAGKTNLVRHSFGLSHSLRNHAVYDRHKDWLLSVDFPASTRIVPRGCHGNSTYYDVNVTGYQAGIRFRPRYYQKHRGLRYYEPWTYRVWNRSVAGWCSWFAYFQNINEENIKKTADVLGEVLVPYGLEYLQIDDGYQQEPVGLPETWNTPNKKFPSGLAALASYIKSKGLKPGIWTNLSFQQKDFAERNPDYFVLDEQGNPAYGRWIGYVLDGSDPETMKDIILPVYRGLREKGWEYFKVDALRHLRYEGYNSYAGYYTERDLDRVEVYRSLVRSIRKEIGPGNFMLGCWGARPELTGILDGCRIGGDGFGYACLAQFNSFNNVVWRNDPDHIVLSPEEAYRSCMVTSLTGSLFMLTDTPGVYRTPVTEPAKRALPILFTLPGQVYDVDPSRTMEFDRVNSELSGDAQRTFDGSLDSPFSLFLLEVNKPYECWVMLGRTEERVQSIAFDDLGLDPEKEYLVFEFWTKQYLGTFTREFQPGPIDPAYHCQLFCIRERQPHPQLMATSRHISCGGFELDSLEWKDQVLSGTSQLLAGEPYHIYLTEPEGYSPVSVQCNGASLDDNRLKGNLRCLVLLTSSPSTVRWSIHYEEKKK
jgi:hypothetical protein